MLSFLWGVIMVLYIPQPPGLAEELSDDLEVPDDHQNLPEIDLHNPHHEWFEEQLEADLKWSFALNGYFLITSSKFSTPTILLLNLSFTTQ